MIYASWSPSGLTERLLAGEGSFALRYRHRPLPTIRIAPEEFGATRRWDGFIIPISRVDTLTHPHIHSSEVLTRIHVRFLPLSPRRLACLCLYNTMASPSMFAGLPPTRHVITSELPSAFWTLCDIERSARIILHGIKPPMNESPR